MALPPLVEPAAELSVEEIRRYSRHLIIPDVGMVVVALLLAVLGLVGYGRRDLRG